MCNNIQTGFFVCFGRARARFVKINVLTPESLLSRNTADSSVSVV